MTRKFDRMFRKHILLPCVLPSLTNLARSFCTVVLLSHLVEAVSNLPNTPQNLRIPFKLRPKPRRQPYGPRNKQCWVVGRCSLTHLAVRWRILLLILASPLLSSSRWRVFLMSALSSQDAGRAALLFAQHWPILGVPANTVSWIT